MRVLRLESARGRPTALRIRRARPRVPTRHVLLAWSAAALALGLLFAGQRLFAAGGLIAIALGAPLTVHEHPLAHRHAAAVMALVVVLDVSGLALHLLHL